MSEKIKGIYLGSTILFFGWAGMLSYNLGQIIWLCRDFLGCEPNIFDWLSPIAIFIIGVFSFHAWLLLLGTEELVK